MEWSAPLPIFQRGKPEYTRSHPQQHTMTYAMANKARRKASLNNGAADMSKKVIEIGRMSPPKQQSQNCEDVDLLQALWTRRQHQHLQEPNGAPRRSLPTVVLPSSSEAEAGATTTTRPQLIAMILAAALQQQEGKTVGGLGGTQTNSVLSTHKLFASTTNANSGIVHQGTSQATVTNFPLPMKLYTVLSSPEFEQILSWQPHGRAWRIRDLDAFCNKVLPIFMNGSSIRHFHGFVSLLNIWGFRQFTKIGPDTSAFFHGAFLRGHPSLLQTMGPLPQANRVLLHDPSSEPNLYALPPLQESKAKVEEQQQQVNLSSLPADLLRRVVESRLPAVQGLRDLDNQHLPLGAGLSRQNFFASSTGPSATPQAGISALQALRAMEGLFAAKQVQDMTLQNMDHARRVVSDAPSANLSDQQLPTVLPTVYTAKPSGLPVDNSKGKKGKKPRRKWLPPLGPATPSFTTLLGSKTKGTIKTKQNASAASSDPSCEWIHTSPEAFAALANPQTNFPGGQQRRC